MKAVEIYTDGACKGNPGPGGWGALLCCQGRERSIYGGEKSTTNNRMELRAVIEALTQLDESCQVTLTTDSQYVRKGISEWIQKWKRNGWKTASGGAVKNKDLWSELDRQAARHQVEWRWVKGHSGHRENDLADELANRGVAEAGESF